MQGVNFAAHYKKKALQFWLEEKNTTKNVCIKFNCSERSLWRWKKQYNGTLESLQPNTSRKNMYHPNKHTESEIKAIVKLFKRQPNITYNEAYGILRSKYAYKRSYGGFYNYVMRHNLRQKKTIERYIPKPYDTPKMLGIKWQLDVKFIPIKCNKISVGQGKQKRLYQYTMLDEATRERFLFPYIEHNGNSTVDFIKRAITYFGYAPRIIQTDNGAEFTTTYRTENTKMHIVDIFLNKCNIQHQCIRPYTPRQNGKVERSHRSDNESFYSTLTFTSFEELKKKMRLWMVRYNNRPHASLKNRVGKQVWWSPLEKRADLLKLLEEKEIEF